MSSLTITPKIAEFEVNPTEKVSTGQQQVHWTVDKCKDPLRMFVPMTGEPTSVTLCIMRHMALLGITKNTKHTSKEFYRRYKIYEYFKGPTMYKDGEPLYVEYGLISHFIGAANNAKKIQKQEFRGIIEKWVMEKVSKQFNSQVNLSIEDRD